MSEVHDCDVDFGKEYPLPGVEPLRALGTTFSAQRYDPRRLPPTLLLSDGAREPTFHDVQEMVVAEMSPTLAPPSASPPPRAILSPEFTRSDSNVSVSRGRETWARKMYNSYENAGKCVRLVWRDVTNCLLASGTVFHNAGRCFCDAIMQVVRPVVGVARGVIPERASLTRAVLH